MMVENWECSQCKSRKQPRLIALRLDTRLPKPFIELIVIGCPECDHVNVLRGTEFLKGLVEVTNGEVKEDSCHGTPSQAPE